VKNALSVNINNFKKLKRPAVHAKEVWALILCLDKRYFCFYRVRVVEEYHPSFDIIGSKGSSLKGKRIVLGITGSIAAVRAPDIARELMRLGAHVFPVMTASAVKIIHPDSIHWATGHKPVVELSGALEHIALAGNVEMRADLVLVAPATANTISKIACAIDDTAVTSVVSVALGQGLPLVLAPAMHESMYNHSLLKENIEKLKRIGVVFLVPEIKEGKAKLMDTQAIVQAVLHVMDEKKNLNKKKVLITAGRTVEYIDPIRVITNNSTGKMGLSLAETVLARGATVTVITGKTAVSYPKQAKVITADTAETMYEAVAKELKTKSYDLFLAAAAVGDWKPKKKESQKISTHNRENLVLELEPTPKIVDQAKKWSPQTFVVAFRAIYKLGNKELVADAHERLKKAGADLMVVNDVGLPGVGFEAETNELWLVSANRKPIHIPKQVKLQAASRLLDLIAEIMAKRK
jgi:phosphopantothenoylcysteine decarboxylase/phosphopantothenate--cysteine ligase